MFSRHEKVVYPGHGVAEIVSVIEKRVAGNITSFFELKFINKDMTILVPTSNLGSVGIRKLSTSTHIDQMFRMFEQKPVKTPRDLTASNWNKRNKEYQCKLRTGDLTEIGKIYRDLRHIATYKELSFGEKTLLQQTEHLLIEEICIVRSVAEDKAVTLLRSFFAPMITSTAMPHISHVVSL